MSKSGKTYELLVSLVAQIVICIVKKDKYNLEALEHILYS